MRFTYPVFLVPDAGGYVVMCRDLSEAITEGDTLDHALEAAEGAIQAAIEARLADGEEVPVPSAARKGERLVPLPVGTAMKAAVYLAMREERINRSELARRLGIDEKQVRRMLDPSHATKVPALERALGALGRRVEVSVS